LTILEETDHSEDLSIHWRIILKRMLKNQERGTFRVGQVVWLPWQHSPNGGKMNILNEIISFYALNKI